MKVRVTELLEQNTLPEEDASYDYAEVALMDEKCALVTHSDGSVKTYVRDGLNRWIDMEGNAYRIEERG